LNHLVFPRVLIGINHQGYKCAAIMISEAALSVVRDYDNLPPLAKKGGVLTPATALGRVLEKRLSQSERFKFSAEIVQGKKEA
jgi:short subunit dehydrogenase-like uncharacterized protein